MAWVPKTLIFAKDDAHVRTSVASAGRAGATDDHCDCIVDAVREVFDEGNAFCKKITYKISKREAEESITNSSGTKLVANQCAAKRGAPWTA